MIFLHFTFNSLKVLSLFRFYTLYDSFEVGQKVLLIDSFVPVIFLHTNMLTLTSVSKINGVYLLPLYGETYAKSDIDIFQFIL